MSVFRSLVLGEAAVLALSLFAGGAFAQAPVTIACPNGAAFDDTLGFCADSANAYGPFTETMTNACTSAGGGPACSSTAPYTVQNTTQQLQRWSRSFTSSLRGTGTCPNGTTASPAYNNQCVETLGSAHNVFAGFTSDLVATCQQAGGGNSCLMTRWDANFYLSVLHSTGGVQIGGPVVEQQIINTVNSAGCLAHNFPQQGQAPMAYLQGLALTYAKSYCEVTQGRNTVAGLLSSPLRSDGLDALNWYGLTSSYATGRLRALYTLAIGEGMRESGGNPTEGYDTTASSHTAANAEAGLFQTSFDSTSYAGVTSGGVTYPGAAYWQQELASFYTNNISACRFSTFLGNQGNTGATPIGSGAGAAFQQLSLSCPAFATEYAMAIFRLEYEHYGPLVRKEAEYATICNSMLSQVETLVRCGER